MACSCSSRPKSSGTKRERATALINNGIDSTIAALPTSSVTARRSAPRRKKPISIVSPKKSVAAATSCTNSTRKLSGTISISSEAVMARMASSKGSFPPSNSSISSIIASRAASVKKTAEKPAGRNGLPVVVLWNTC